MGVSFEHSARLYDALYAARGKDYGKEAAFVRRLLPKHASSVLDVGCGTGEHLQRLAPMGALCGLDADTAMLRVAHAKLPQALLFRGDMRSFALRRRFDAVTCLFASIGYLADATAVGEALCCMAQHVAPGGVLLVEPPLGPARLKPPERSTLSVVCDGGVVDRITTAQHEPGRLRILFDYAFENQSGVQSFREEHVILSLPVSFFRSALERIGCEVHLEDTWPSGAGLLLARNPT
jgi:SAM-dependent methyltransferase